MTSNEGRPVRRRTRTVTNGGVLSAVQELRQDFNDFRQEVQDWRNTEMPRQFMTRAEVELLTRESADDRKDLHGMVLDLQAWRLAQIKAENERYTTLELRIESAANKAVTEAMASQIKAQQMVSTQRAALDGRTIGFYSIIAVTVLTALLNLLLTYFKPR